LKKKILRKKLNKEINNEYVKYFKSKVEKDIERERSDIEAQKAK